MRRVTVESAARLLITAAVGLIGAAAGFTHTHDAAVHAGQTGWLAWADAVVIECMVVVAGLRLARDRAEGRTGRLALGVMVLAFLIQMGAQVSGAPMTFAGWLFAAIPALGCLVVVKFAVQSWSTEVEPAAPAEVDEFPVVPEQVHSDVDRFREIDAAPQPQVTTAWPPR